MSKNSEIPLYVYQVLEEEYESLHGAIRENVTTHLPNPEDENKPVAVESKRDWDFHEGHIKRPEVLAEILGSDALPRRHVSAKRVARHAGPTDVKMVGLKKHLSEKIGDDVLKGTVGVESRSGIAVESGDDYETTLRRRLNELLKEPDLFWEQSEKSNKRGAAADDWKFEPGKERFAYGWLTNETRGLLDERRLGLLPRHAVLVNVARGAIVEQAALVPNHPADRVAEVADLVGAPEAEPVGRDHTEVLGERRKRELPTDLGGATVFTRVQQHDGRAGAGFEIVRADTVDIDPLAD